VEELAQVGFELGVVGKNINRFLSAIVTTFRKNEDKLNTKLLLTKEDKQLVTKSKIIALTEVYALSNLLYEVD
jgi:hypothetical protein